MNGSRACGPGTDMTKEKSQGKGAVTNKTSHWFWFVIYAPLQLLIFNQFMVLIIHFVRTNNRRCFILFCVIIYWSKVLHVLFFLFVFPCQFLTNTLGSFHSFSVMSRFLVFFLYNSKFRYRELRLNDFGIHGALQSVKSK